MKKQCDQLWRDCVKLRDKLHCTIPGCTYGVTYETRQLIEAHHIHKKSSGNWQLLYDLHNGDTLCPKHHAEAHANESEYIDKLPTRLTDGRWGVVGAILARRHEVCREKPDYKEIKRKLAELKRYFKKSYWWDQ